MGRGISLMFPKILLPKGFSAGGVNSGVRRYRPDLGILFSDRACSSAGVFTVNTFKAAPVTYNRALLPSDSIRGLICNSGQANSATGEDGIRDNLELAEACAKELGVSANQILVASTGVVGERLPLQKLKDGIPVVKSESNEFINNFALAIMTTDLVPKFGSETVLLSGGEVTITGAAKGSGMIHPNMATMLCFFATDLKIKGSELQKLVTQVMDRSFNMISVDGETSTNDMGLVLANGASGVAIQNPDDLQKFADAFLSIATRLARSIARDGEGASKLLTVELVGSPSLELARRVARSITISPLIKSAVYGEDPNWGRIVVRMGQEGVPEELLNSIHIDLQGFRVFESGRPAKFDRKQVSTALSSDEVVIRIDLGSGNHSATAWGCDLTKRYVEINAEYS
jgi:glutamate N-acetyltransferase/amino-acid N-acetyltransferase